MINISFHSLSCLAFVTLLSACAGFIPQPGPGIDPEGSYQQLTTPFVALGDTQEHLSTGYPMHDNDSAVDAYVEVAQRPPEQTLFGRRVMEWALASHPDEPFIHLGDVMDLSCRIEADRMARIFRAAPHPGAILPGNHDGLMFGIYAYSLLAIESDADARKWNRACRRGAAPDDLKHKTDNEAFSKRDFISLYITEHTRRVPAKPGLSPPPQNGVHVASWRSPDPDAFLSGIEAKLLDGIAYADSYLAQRIKLPRAAGARRDVIVIGLDTNQAGPLVSAWDAIMGRSPGSRGHIHPDQIAAVTKWVSESIERKDIVIFAGHHNWNSLGLYTRVMLRALMRMLEHPLVYLSAHTHTGFWAEHRVLATQPLLELNVSSMSDWPIAYRRISFAYDERENRLLVRGDLMPQSKQPLTSDADLLAAWDAQTCRAVGVPSERLRAEDLALVKQQRESRGNLLEWMLSALAPLCETCEQPIYQHAQTYLEELLLVILQLDDDLGRDAHRLHELPLPAWCASQDFVNCARTLIAERASNFTGHTELFRRKATLVALLNDHLDDLSNQEVKAYMTCRAVQSSRIDFDLTDDAHNDHRGEAKRISQQFFRIEASVGMD
ncbi:MAG: hypothetical protein V5B36_18315 [Candidatus Accumulibacter sp. UW25]|jgi:hypothetical protein